MPLLTSETGPKEKHDQTTRFKRTQFVIAASSKRLDPFLGLRSEEKPAHIEQRMRPHDFVFWDVERRRRHKNWCCVWYILNFRVGEKVAKIAGEWKRKEKYLIIRRQEPKVHSLVVPTTSACFSCECAMSSRLVFSVRRWRAKTCDLVEVCHGSRFWTKTNFSKITQTTTIPQTSVSPR